MRARLTQAALRKEISDVADLRTAMMTQSKGCLSECVFFEFKPPSKKDLEVRVLDSLSMRKAGMGVQSSYSWSTAFDLAKNVIIRSHVLTGRPIAKTVYANAVASAKITGEDKEEVKGDWRFAYRKLTPEKEPPSIKQLRKHFAEQHYDGAAMAGRHTAMQVRIERLERKRARRKNDSATKKQRERDAEAQADEPDSSSSSASSSSTSSFDSSSSDGS